MTQFRKKPVVIEAVLFRLGEQDGAFVKDVVEGRVRYPEDGTMLIKTLEGEMCAQPGDWIIRGIKGELYPCKKDIFEATYDAAAPLSFQDRVIAEKDELDDKISKLKAFGMTTIFAGLPTEEKQRLTEQETHMSRYSDVLAQRIAAFA